MYLEGRFVFISAEKRESDGKIYHNVNIESEDDGKMYRFGATEDAVAKLIKYRPYKGFFEPRVWNNQLSLNLVDAEALAPAK